MNQSEWPGFKGQHVLYMEWALSIASLLFVELGYYGYKKKVVYPKLIHSTPPPTPTKNAHLFEHPATVVRHVYRVCESSATYRFETWLKGAFLNVVDPAQIGTLNYESFLAWYLFVSRIGDLEEEDRRIVRELREEAVQLFGYPKIDGYVQGIRHCTLGLDDFSPIHLPLTGVALFAGMEYGYHFFGLRRVGFRPFEAEGIRYWFFSHPSTDKDPVVFLHGMGAGLWSYSEFISELCKTRSILLIQNDCVLIHSSVSSAQNYDHTALSKCVQHAMQQFAISKISVIGHSWGTFLAGWLIRTMPDKISHLTLIDPVALFVPYPDTINYVVYKPPESLREWVFHYLVRGNENISYTLSRHFAWYNNNLSIKDIPETCGLIISLSEKDELLDTTLAVEQIKALSRPYTLLYWENLFHGGAADQRHSIEQIIEVLNK
jgi:pimeloyl-ACP methyl ester carboxylesterase